MNQEELNHAARYSRAGTRRRIWKRFVSGVACVVVFCTVYALILPAITLEQTPICGKEEHTHDESCYEQIAAATVPVCTLDRLDLHEHTDACLDENLEYCCGYSDFVVHRHDGSCYDGDGKLWCPLPEVKPHAHDDSCYDYVETETAHTHTENCYALEQGELICGESTETAAHSHTEECYTAQEELTCTVPESDGHRHEEACRDESGALTCGQEESEGHHHSPECYENVSVLTCGLSDLPHQHTDECFQWTEVLICEASAEPEESAEPVLICGKEEILLHTHTDECFDTDGSLICGQVQVLEHVHNQDCFRPAEEAETAQVLICELEEHTHTEACFLRDGLTEEEWAQVDRVSALIAALPTRQEIEEKLTALEEAGDGEGYDAALTQYVQTAREAQTACDALTEPQREKLPDITPLEELAWLLTALPDASGTAAPKLDGDYAYIEKLQIVEKKDGTAPFDGDNDPGNDPSETNNILRTFDLATYTLQFQTTLRKDANPGGYTEGRVYYKLFLPVPMEQATFDLSGMSWMQTVKDPQIISEPKPGEPTQTLSGSFILTPSPGNDVAIGEGYSQITVAIRALDMKNGQEIKPQFTMWLEYNTDVDHKSVDDTLTVSAASQYNVELVEPDNANTASGTYDFSTGDADAPNKTKGSVKGYMMGFGLSLQLRSDRNRGLLGMEMPDGNTEISFDLDLSSVYHANGVLRKTDDYPLLLWSGGGNSAGDAQGRATKTHHTAIVEVPYNQYQDPAATYEYNSCYDGGTWTFTQDGNTVHVKVKGFRVDASRFPFGTSVQSENHQKYYTPSQDSVQNWSGIRAAVFSAGEFWLLQPVESLKDQTPIENLYEGVGQFTIDVKDRDLKVNGVSTDQTDNTDDSASRPYRLGGGGTVSAALTYNQYRVTRYDGSLINRSHMDDTDWAVLGQGVTLRAQLSQTGADGGSRLAAADLLVKFDGEFFEPDTTVEDPKMNTEAATVYMPSYARDESSYYWAVKPDGSNWTSDEEMKRATEDDLVYYRSLASIPGGHIPVGLLLEIRGSVWGTYPVCINGKVKETSQPGKVYMMTHANLVWTRNDVANALGKAEQDMTDAECKNYVKNTLPSRNPSTPGNKTQLINGGTEWNPESDYIEPTNRQDYYVTAELEYCKKASYDTGGYHAGLYASKFQDSCLVVPYRTAITKSTAQTDNYGAKKAYGISQNQRVVDFVLQPTIQGYLASGEATDATKTVTVTVRDVLPDQLIYLNGTAYRGGTYQQDPNFEKPGTVTGGEALDPVITTEGGQTVLIWTFQTTVDLQANYLNQLGPIYFSCQINEEEVTGSSMSFSNQATVMTSGEQFRGYDPKHGNVANFGITVNRIEGASITKLADQNNADWWAPVSFLMNAGNNSGTDLTNVLITDTLPATGKNDGTVYDAPLVVTGLKLGAKTEADARLLMNSLQFYYTTDPAYAGLEGTALRQALDKPEELMWQDHLTAQDNWNPLTEPTQFTSQGSWFGGEVTGLPTAAEQNNNPITAIVATGTLPANKTLKMHVTLKLPKGKDKDNLVNYLSMSLKDVDLRTFATTRLVSRSLAGLTWLDSDTNGIQNNISEEQLSGVKVMLLKLKAGSTDPSDIGSYEPFHYQDDPLQPVVTVETGKTVSAQTTKTGDLMGGSYSFTDLPSGIYAVKFTSGSTNIESFAASPENQGGNDTMDSDGVPTYVDGKLQYTVITNIDLRDKGGKPNSFSNDSGFYSRGHELPKTGGAGTTQYTIGGLLTVSVGFLLLYSIQKRRKEETASS